MKLHPLFDLARASRPLLLAALALLGTGTLPAANFFDNAITVGATTIDLGNASGGGSPSVSTHKNWAIFALSGGVSISDTSYTGPGGSYNPSSYDVWGNVGLGGSGVLTMSNSWIKGSAYSSAAGHITGGNITDSGTAGPTVDPTYLSNAVASATNASTAAASLANTANTVAGSGPNALIYGGALSGGAPATISLATAASITGVANQTYVLNLTDLVLSGAGAILTLNGASTTNYVINVNRLMSLSTNAQIKLGAGGIAQSNVLFNLTSANTNDVILNSGAKVNGIILAPTRAIKLTGGAVVTGEVIGKSVSLTGRSKVINPNVSP